MTSPAERASISLMAKFEVNVHSFPDELLALVFEQALWNDFNTSMLRYYRHLFNFALVCRRWQQVLHNARTFWRGMPYDVPEEAVKFLARKSYPAPLTIAGSKGDSICNWRQLGRLVSFRRRWLSVKLHIHPDVYDTLLMLLKGPMPILEHLEITIEPEPDNESDFFALDSPVSDATDPQPRLLEMIFDGIPRNIGVPKTLRSLHLVRRDRETGWSMEQLVSLLQHCPQLESLTCSGRWESEGPLQTVPQLHNLRRLSLFPLEGGRAMDLLKNLLLPPLESIHLEIDSQLEDTSIATGHLSEDLMHLRGRITQTFAEAGRVFVETKNLLQYRIWTGTSGMLTSNLRVNTQAQYIGWTVSSIVEAQAEVVLCGFTHLYLGSMTSLPIFSAIPRVFRIDAAYTPDQYDSIIKLIARLSKVRGQDEPLADQLVIRLWGAHSLRTFIKEWENVLLQNKSGTRNKTLANILLILMYYDEDVEAARALSEVIRKYIGASKVIFHQTHDAFEAQDHFINVVFNQGCEKN